jgi:hypothetical protein
MSTTPTLDPITAATITAALETSGQCTLGPGMIEIDEPILIKGPCSLIGAGFGTRLHASGDFPIIDMSQAPTIPVGVSISGLRLTRQNTQNGPGGNSQSQGIVLWGQFVTVREVWIEDCLTGIQFATGLGVSSQVRLDGINISNILANAVFTGIDVDEATDVTLFNCAPDAKRNYCRLNIGNFATDLHGSLEVFRTLPAGADGSRYLTDLAGDNPTSTFAPDNQPDIPRNVTVDFDPDWDGGDITVIGKDQFGLGIFEVLPSTPGAFVAGEKTFATISEIQKSAVGADPAVCNVGMGVSIGVAKRMIAESPNSMLFVDDIGTGITSVSRVYSSFISDEAPNGTRLFKFFTPVIGS